MGLLWFPRIMARPPGESRKGKLQFGPHSVRQLTQHWPRGGGTRLPAPKPVPREGPKTGSRATGLKNTAVIARVLKRSAGDPKRTLVKARGTWKESLVSRPLPHSDQATEPIRVQGDGKLFREWSGSLEAWCIGILVPPSVETKKGVLGVCAFTSGNTWEQILCYLPGLP